MDRTGSSPSPARVVAVGGGHGLSRTLRALRTLPVDITAVVATADDGGSSGRLRRDLGVLPPGDLRKALAALTPDPDLARLLEYRFAEGDVAGHTVGNLLMVAASDLAGGDVAAALARLGAWVGALGRVLPATTRPVVLVAESHAGEQTRGQLAVATSSGHRRVRVDPETVDATPGVAEAIRTADLLTLGPGSLFTSILPSLVVPAIAEAVTTAPAPIVLIANLREQPGETEGLALGDHLDVLAEHIPDRKIDVLVVHDGPAPRGPGRPLLPVDHHPNVGRVVGSDLLDGNDGHDPSKLAAVLQGVLQG
jgi:uncharacterized cofD-like protein